MTTFLRRITLFTMLVSFVAVLAGCTAAKTDIADLYKGQTETHIYQEGVRLLKKEDYDSAGKRFQVIDVRYPFGHYAQQSRLNIIYCYYMLEDSASTLASTERYIRLYPRGPHADYAYYMQGLTRFNENHSFFDRHSNVDFAKRDMTELKRAFNDFGLLIHYFPKSRYAPDARQRMLYIRNALARHELEVAQFYYGYRSYVAAANRANRVVQQYQGAPSVPHALALMVKSYQQLGLTKDANESAQVLRLNFPNYKMK